MKTKQEVIKPSGFLCIVSVLSEYLANVVFLVEKADICFIYLFTAYHVDILCCI